MTLTAVTAPFPNYVEHTPHTDGNGVPTPGDTEIRVSSADAGILCSLTGTNYLSIGLEWDHCVGHFPLAVSYKVVTTDGSLSSTPSATTIVDATPKYDVWIKHNVNLHPIVFNQMSDWFHLTTTTKPSLSPTVYGVSYGVSQEPYVQFAVTPYMEDKTGFMERHVNFNSGRWDSSGTSYGPNTEWVIYEEDYQIIGITESIKKAL